MSIRCSVLSAALLAGCVAPVASARQASTVVSPVAAPAEREQPRNPGRIALIVGTTRIEAAVSIDRAAISPQGPRDVTVLAQHGALVVVTDSYGSRPQGLSRCQAGSEVYARVIDVHARQERFAKLVESCLKPVLSGDPAFAKAIDGRSVTFNLLSEPASTVTLGDDGSVKVLP